MENTSLNKTPSYSTYSWVLSGDYLFRKATGLPQRDNSAVETNTPIRGHIGRRDHRPRRNCLWHSSGVYFSKCACVYLCLWAISRLPCWIIRCVGPVYLWLWWAVRRWWPVGNLADRAVMDHSSHTLATSTCCKWLYRRVVMTCDGCCFGRRAHFCLVSARLSVFMSRSVDFVLCFDDTYWLCLDVNFSFLAPTSLLSSHLHLHFCCSPLLLCHFPLFYLDLVCFVLSISFTCPFLSPTFLFLFTFALAFLLPASSISFPWTLSTLFCFIHSVCVYVAPHLPNFGRLLICFIFFLTLCPHSICLPHPYLSHFPPSDS